MYMESFSVDGKFRKALPTVGEMYSIAREIDAGFLLTTALHDLILCGDATFGEEISNFLNIEFPEFQFQNLNMDYVSDADIARWKVQKVSTLEEFKAYFDSHKEVIQEKYAAAIAHAEEVMKRKTYYFVSID